MKRLFLIFFLFFAYSEEKSAGENSEEPILFTVEDTPKSASQEFFTIKEKETPLPEEPVVSSELVQTPEPPAEEPETPPEQLIEEEPEPPKEEIVSVVVQEPPQKPPQEPVIVLEQEETPPPIEEKEVELEISKPKVDILIVVDNSGSMRFILGDIDHKMQTFEETLSPVDYRIGFINAEMILGQEKRLMDLEQEGQIFTQQKFLEPGMDPQILIDTLVRRKKEKCDTPPYCGKRKERPLSALETYLFSRNSEEFMREESRGLAVLIITDNEENPKSKDEPSAKAEDVIKIFEQRYPNKLFKAYTFTILDEVCQREVRSRQFLFKEGHFAPSVAALAEQTGGESLSLCLSSYQFSAEQIVRHFSAIE